MVTLVWRTDVHGADESPSSRTDNWAETILSKLEQVGEIARSVNADAVIDGGDLFHFKSPGRNSHWLISRISEVHAKYPCPTYGCIGNHDVKYGDYSFLAESPLGVLFETGVFRRLYDQHEAIFEKDGTKVRVVGVPYHGTKYDKNRLTSIQRKDEKHLVAVAHLLASPSGGAMFEGEDIVSYKDLGPLDPDLWCFGHWHKDQGVQEVEGKTIINIGSLSRGALSLDEITREPGVAIMRFEGDKRSVEVHRLKIEPADKVFDFERRVRAESREMSMGAFVDSLQTSLQGRPDESLLGKVRGLKDLPSEVRERSVHYLEKAGAK